MTRSLLTPAALVFAGLLIASSYARSDELTPGVHFSHHDWEVACDNTRTCRAAGYQAEEDDPGVSVLLTRPAGPDTNVSGELRIARYDREHTATAITLRIDGKDVGNAALDSESGVAGLSTKQVEALLAVLPRSAEILAIATDGSGEWRLSDSGAAAVLLKMDEIQGRVGTRSALIRRGEADDAGVLPPLPKPVLRLAARSPTREDDRRLGDDATLRAALLASAHEQERCDSDLVDAEAAFEIERLDDDHLLASTVCWRGAYNESYAYWIIDAQPPHRLRLVTTSANGYENGELSASHKGRGLGDCWSSETWVWNGDGFTQAGQATTGMCRLIELGGAWDLPTLVSDIER